MNRGRWYGWPGLLLLAALMLPGCSKKSETAAAGEDKPNGAAQQGGAAGDDASAAKPADGPAQADTESKQQAVPVEVVELERGPIEAVLKYSSTLEAESQVKVYAEAARLVRELRVEEGDRVAKGDVLVRLQDEEQRNQLAKVRNELAKAEREYERQQRLYNEQLISEEEFNQKTFELDQLRISLADAERELSYTEVKAPIGGTITQRLVNLGDQVTVGQHLFDIVDFDSLVARVYVPEKHLPELKPGLIARVSSRALGGKEYRGAVDRIAPIVDSRTGTVKVTVDVGGQPGLLPGMYVDVDLVTATRPAAVLVPKRALVYDNDQMFVFRLGEGRRVERVFVEPAISDKFNVEPQDGLAAGDRVVVAGQAGLKDGARVKLPGDPDEKDDTAEKTDTVARVQR